MVDVTYTLEGANGDVITFDNETYVLTVGISGFGIPPTNVRIEDSAGDGGVFRQSKRLPRDVDLPITIFGSNRADVEAKLRRLGKILQDNQGAPKLRATYDNPEVSDLFLNVHYVAGGETVIDNNSAGQTFCRWVISLRAANPFWLSGVQEEFSIGKGSTGRGLLPQLTKLKLASNLTLGVVTVVNAGDVSAFPVWRITGPVDDLLISNGTQSFGFASVADGEVINVNTETGSVTDDANQNLYARLLPAPKLFSLPPGTTGISVLGINVNEDFNVQLTYSPRYEVVH